MKYIEKHPMIMIVIGVWGISVSSILVRFSTAPSVVTAAWRMLWTVLLMLPVVLGNKTIRQEMMSLNRKNILLCILSGVFLAIHFAIWFESLRHTSVASATTIVCTEVIWVTLGFWLFLKGKLSVKALISIGVTLVGSFLIALSDSTVGQSNLYGDFLALIAAIVVAVYTLLGQIVRKTASTTVYTFLVYCSCAAVLVMLCLCRGYALQDYGFRTVTVGFLMAVFPTILGHSIFSWCLRYFSPSFVSASKLCEPVAAAAMAAVLFGEGMSVMQIFGGVLILSGVLYYSFAENKA